jgi:methylmalonyl-CoA mutase C-terminal domain/subunit
MIPEMVASTALQEDVDVVALSILSGAHMTLFPRVKRLLDEKGLADVLVTGGGIIPAQDAAELRTLGIGKLFTPGTTMADAVDYIRSWVESRDAAGGSSDEPADASSGGG